MIHRLAAQFRSLSVLLRVEVVTIVCLTRVWQSLFPLFVTKRSSFPSKLGKNVRSTTTYMCKHIFVSTPQNVDFAH